MKRQNNKQSNVKNNSRNNNRDNVVDFEPARKKQVRIVPRNLNQETYLDLLLDESKSIVIATGPAGTGKSLLAMTAAIKALKEQRIEKIIMTRPAVAVEDEKLGFLPGTLDEKCQPWLIPLFDILHEYYSVSDTEHMVASKIIEIAPLSMMRGRTFKNAFIIVDESQNCTPSQLLMVLTRIGENSRIFVTGDVQQSDRKIGNNGLADLLNKLKNNVNTFGLIEFARSDIVRHPMVQEVLELYGEI
jgi:phosphate starvation-inducible PhoH-like protein